MNTKPTSISSGARRWRIRVGATAAGAVLIGGAVLGATAALADSQSPSPSAGAPSAAPTAAKPGSGTNDTRHPFARALRTELRVDIQARAGFGDKAHEVAYVLIHHTEAFAKLPANLQADLKTLESAAAADRDGDATKIKDTALNGGYGNKIQEQAKTIQTNATQMPAKP
jgi:hypothetical protein